MATYFVSSGGSNTSPYDTWAKAATSLQTALTAASSGTDVVVVQYDGVPSGDAEVAANTTYTLANHVQLISASNDGGSSYTPTAMGTSYWIGNSTTHRSITVAGGFRLYCYGITWRTAGSTGVSLVVGSSDNSHYEFESVYFWQGNTGVNQPIAFGASNVNSYVICRDCTLRFGATSQTISQRAVVEFYGGSVSSAGSAPSALIGAGSLMGPSLFSGVDLSHVTGTLVASNTGIPMRVAFERCKLGTGVTPLGAQTPSHKAGGSVFLLDCSSGDTHGIFGYYDALGQCVSSTSVYYTSGAAGQSWKIDTTSSATFDTPFVTPWIDLYNTGTSAITPFVEIIRDTSTTAYKDDEVWAEFSAKTTSGSVQATLYRDRSTIQAHNGGTASNQATGAGTGSWTGENASAWSGKCDSGSAFTPAEAGHIRARLCVGVNTSTTPIYLDPQIRT